MELFYFFHEITLFRSGILYPGMRIARIGPAKLIAILEIENHIRLIDCIKKLVQALESNRLNFRNQLFRMDGFNVPVEFLSNFFERLFLVRFK